MDEMMPVHREPLWLSHIRRITDETVHRGEMMPRVYVL